jgi:hypothetical protein
MNSTFNLKELERKAFRSFFKDGLWDLFFGLVMFAMYAFTVFNNMENKALRVLVLLGLEGVAAFVLIYGKTQITAPRLGTVVFGKKRKRRFVYIFLVNSISLIVLAGSLALKLSRPDLMENDLISTIGTGVWITFITSLMAYFLDFNRLYIYGLIYGAAFTLVLLLDLPILFLVASLLILIPGSLIFIRFITTTKPVKKG